MCGCVCVRVRLHARVLCLHGCEMCVKDVLGGVTQTVGIIEPPMQLPGMG